MSTTATIRNLLRRKIYLDMNDGGGGPKRGDRLVAIGKKGPGARYIVLTSTRVQRRDPNAKPRYKMWVRAVEEAIWKSKDIGRSEVFTFTWYPREKNRMTMEEYVRARQWPNERPEALRGPARSGPLRSLRE